MVEAKAARESEKDKLKKKLVVEIAMVGTTTKAITIKEALR